MSSVLNRERTERKVRIDRRKIALSDCPKLDSPNLGNAQILTVDSVILRSPKNLGVVLLKIEVKSKRSRKEKTSQ